MSPAALRGYAAATMNRLLLGSAPLLSFLLAAGCASVPVGEFKFDKEVWETAQMEVRQRASFELKCPKEQLKLTVLAATVVSHGPG